MRGKRAGFSIGMEQLPVILAGFGGRIPSESNGSLTRTPDGGGFVRRTPWTPKK